MSDDCLFCKIISGDIPGDIVEQTDTVLAFRDINPQANTHILIIPKLHIESTRDLNNENINCLSEMAALANKIADSERIAESGYRWIINTGDDGGQTVHHLHLHLLGGRQMNWPPG
ncbi:MAG: histidine triad nucleotide-binding protein [Candidatus Marinimicrobia bacterium]|nr:histidine triad nucleotide-binding protein [Candidatus Neomarinimicrobiota bacterium]